MIYQMSRSLLGLSACGHDQWSIIVHLRHVVKG